MKSYDELNALLLDGVIAYSKAHPHPEQSDMTVWQAFEAERAALVPYAGRFDGFHAVTASVSSTCLVRFDNNRYSVAASAIGRPAEVRAYAERVEIRQDGRIVAEHARVFGRNQTVFDPWHYVPRAGSQARRAAQRRTVQGLGPARRPRPGPAQARRLCRR